MTSLSVDAIDPRDAAPTDLEAIWRVADAVAEHEGRDVSLRPPVPHAVREWRHHPAHEHVRLWEAARGDGALGYAATWWADRADNRDHVGAEVVVDPEAQGQGVGRGLLREALRHATAAHRARLVDVSAPLAGPAHGWLERLGAPARLVERRSVCERSSLDRSVLEGWVERAAERASGYSLVQWDGPCPRDLVDDFCRLKAVMNTAPIDDLDYEPEEFTPTHLAEHWASWVAQETDWWTVCARHDDTGELVAFTTMRRPRHWREHAEQEDTGVVPAHRDRGLGRWVKAVSALRLLDECPEIERVATWNAASNGPMLRLNVAMGFEGRADWAEHQAEADALLARLGDAR
ncbi:MAG TPA: GNAT family N-acetyltransferase [Acidimicrobiia bacterium]|nr:GNAT family N-acetyltransferase [Acidimicrobiia bacterium]